MRRMYMGDHNGGNHIITRIQYEKNIRQCELVVCLQLFEIKMNQTNYHI